jgi:hypothetical protein
MSGLSTLWDFMNPVRIWEKLNFAKELQEYVLQSGRIEEEAAKIGPQSIPKPTLPKDLSYKSKAVSIIAVVQKLDNLHNLHKGFVYDAFAGISLWGVLITTISAVFDTQGILPWLWGILVEKFKVLICNGC